MYKGSYKDGKITIGVARNSGLDDGDVIVMNGAVYCLIDKNKWIVSFKQGVKPLDNREYEARVISSREFESIKIQFLLEDFKKESFISESHIAVWGANWKFDIDRLLTL